MNDELEEINIDGEIVRDSFSTRAPKIKLNRFRYLFRDPSASFFLNLAVGFGLVAVLSWFAWSKIVGIIFLILAVLTCFGLARLLANRSTEFMHALLVPGIVVQENPPKILVLANLACGGASEEHWAVALADSRRTLRPFSKEVGTRIPCVAGFLGDGFNGSWDKMIVHPLTSGSGNKKKLQDALERLNDDDEWEILEGAVRDKKFPLIGKTIRLDPNSV
ncbi:MAG: DUF3239 domain-containing protein [Verrucomicrobiota bacterium]